MTTPELPAGVTQTAVLTCYARAQESRGDSPLFQDPLARHFVSAATGVDSSPGSQLPPLGPARDDGSSALWNSLHWTFAGRTPFFDQHVTDAVGRGVRQVVLLAAGMDCRAYRLALPAGTVVYELDLRPLLAFKDHVLAAHGWDFSHRDLCDEVSRLGLPRPPLFNRHGPDPLRCWLVSASMPGTWSAVEPI
jgi:methyltransferase (TIGR00027 family)